MYLLQGKCTSLAWGTNLIRISHAWYTYRLRWRNKVSMDAVDFIQYVNDNRDVLHTKCEAEHINEKQYFTNENIQEFDCIFNTQDREFSTNIDWSCLSLLMIFNYLAPKIDDVEELWTATMVIWAEKPNLFFFSFFPFVYLTMYCWLC